jgi:putative pyruvate formate lyase activating enzyme
MKKYLPGYIKLYYSGELEQRANELISRLRECNICPRNCKVNRLVGEKGFCYSGYLPIVSSYCAHTGEEPPLSGRNGSGTVFFGNCNMRCVYCQNYQISQDWSLQKKNEVSITTLSKEMLILQNDMHCHNINLVTPSHFIPQILMALLEAVPLGLNIPLIYNTSGYDSINTIKMLDGIIDIYLPDLRYADDINGKNYSGVPDYTYHVRENIKEMYRQVGNLDRDKHGFALKGLIVRHLILPGQIAGSVNSLSWLANEISREVTISIMAQYYPIYKANQFPIINRRIKKEEYLEVLELVKQLNLENGWIQEIDASDNYQPDFTKEGHPFEERRY